MIKVEQDNVSIQRVERFSPRVPEKVRRAGNALKKRTKKRPRQGFPLALAVNSGSIPASLKEPLL